jgi:hypothetical protein
MSLITQSSRKPAVNETELMIESARRKARIDFQNESAEELLKSTYEAEKARLRKGEPPPVQKATTSPPQATTRKESIMDTDRRVKAMTTDFMAQSPTPKTLKPVAPIPQPSADTSGINPDLAKRCAECWRDSTQARRDFSSLAAFYDFALESEKKNSQLPDPRKEICGLAFYERQIAQRDARISG